MNETNKDLPYSLNLTQEPVRYPEIIQTKIQIVEPESNKKSNNQSIHSENFNISFESGLDPELSNQLSNREPKFQSKTAIDAPKRQVVRHFDFGGESEIFEKKLDRNPSFQNLKIRSIELGIQSTKFSSIGSSPGKAETKSCLLGQKGPNSEVFLTSNPSLCLGIKHHTSMDFRQSEAQNYQEALREPGMNQVPLILESPKSESEPLSHQGNLLGQDRVSHLMSQISQPISPNLSLNQNQVELEVASDQEMSPSQVPEARSDPELDIEFKIDLKRIIVLFLASALSSFTLIFVIQDKISFWAFFLTLYCYWVYVAVENMVASRKVQRQEWRRKDDYFRAWDGVSAIIAQACFNLKMIEVIPYSSGACIPFFVMAVLYFLSKKPQQTPSNKRLLVKLFYGLQILLATLRYDEIIDWSWSATFSLLWLYLGVISLYFGMYVLFLVLNALVLFCKHMREATPHLGIILIGLTWYSVSYGLGVVGIIYLNQLASALKIHQSLDTLTPITWVVAAINGFLVIYTGIFFKDLFKFFQVANATINVSNRLNQLSGQDKKEQQQQIAFETEKKNSYFVMMSSTYFLPLNSHILAKKKFKFQGIKRTLSQISMRAFKKTDLNLTNISLGRLQQQKQNLDEKFESIKLKNERDQLLKGTLRKSNKHMSDVPKSKTSIENGPLRKVRKNFSTIHDESSNLQVKNPRDNKIAEDDNICYICFEKTADAILMNCGHGGICYECAVALVQKSKTCMQCRMEVETIYRVDPIPKLSNIVKSFESTKIV